MTRQADREALQRVIGGVVVLPDAAGYDSARQPAMARFGSVRSAAVVLCTSATDVSETLLFARGAGSPRSFPAAAIRSPAGHRPRASCST